MKTYKKGISLIVLVITVLVLAILATTVIISLSNTNIINEANKAVVKSRFKSMQEQLSIYVADQISATNGTFKMVDLDAEAKSSMIDTIFPELKDSKYYDYVSIIDGKIVLADGMPDRDVAVEIIGEYVEPEVITNYTQADIDNSDGKLLAIGATDNLGVVAAFSDDFSSVIITKNGDNSDGAMVSGIYDWNDFSQLTYVLPSETSATLTSVVIEKGVTSIGAYAFRNYNKLASVEIPTSVTSIGEHAFDNAGLTSVIIPNSVMSIGDEAFICNAKLTSIEIPDSVTSIGRQIFATCTGLTSVTIPASIVSVKASMFDNCSSLKSIIIPEGIISIESSAFSGCTSLEKVSIPASVTSINGGAFHGCTGLETLNFEGTTTQWGDITFGSNWNKNVPATEVVCSDGTVTL